MKVVLTLVPNTEKNFDTDLGISAERIPELETHIQGVLDKAEESISKDGEESSKPRISDMLSDIVVGANNENEAIWLAFQFGAYITRMQAPLSLAEMFAGEGIEDKGVTIASESEK